MTLLEELIRDKMHGHPLPWTIDYDWCVEVLDREGRLVLKLQRDVEARELIEMATRIAAERAEFEVEFERMIDDYSQADSAHD